MNTKPPTLSRNQSGASSRAIGIHLVYGLLCMVLLSACGANMQFPGIVTLPPPALTRVVSPSPTSFKPGSGASTPTQKVEPSPTIKLGITPTAQITALPLPTKPGDKPTALPTDTPAPDSQLGGLPGYKIGVTMDYDAKTMDVTQEIVFTNPSPDALPDILLAVQPNRLAGVFELLDLRFNDQVINDYTLKGQRLSWKLATPLAPGETAHISMHYNLTLPLIEQGDPNQVRPQIFGVTERQVNLIDWYPMMVPFQTSGGWLLHDPWAYGEHLVYPLANFEVSLHFTDPVNAPIIAASGESVEKLSDGERFTLENGRDFVFAMGRQLKTVSVDMENVTITSYFYPGNANAGQAVLDATSQAVKTYTELFGPYPHKTLAAVQGDFNDAMEFDGLYYLSNSFYNLYDGTVNSFLVARAAHETSHQWWFGRVANDQNDQPWLDEALATYSELIFYEKNHLASVDWWWTYIIDVRNPEGKIDGSVPSYAGFDPYMKATYYQGAKFFDELRLAIGDEAFFAFLKDYSTQMNGKIATSDDFFRILKDHSDTDLTTLIDKYFSSR